MYSASISSLISDSYRSVLNAVRVGQPWQDVRLNQLTQEARIIFRPLGPVVDTPYGQVAPEELSVPLVWAPADDALPFEDRLAIAAGLMRSAIESHDDVLCEMIARRRPSQVIVSPTYRYDLGEPTVLPTHTVVKIYTALAFAPRG